MMHRALIRIALAASATIVFPGALAQQECEPAVDMIESNDAVNRISECDYSDEGINGWLSGLGERKPTESAAAASSSASASGAEGGEFELSSAPVAEPLALLQARFALISKAAQRCEQGAAIVKLERYRPLEGGKLRLEMRFQCQD